jgi:hypothetical protein
MNSIRNKNFHIAELIQNFKLHNYKNNNNVDLKNLFHTINFNKKIRSIKINKRNVPLDKLNNLLNNDLSQSVFDLVNCFICLCPAQDPLSCPKCNNFGCRKCLESYFGNAKKKPCPICQQYITFILLKKNTDIEEVKKILNKNDTKKNKYIELSQLISKKKKNFKDKDVNSSNILERLLKYQDNLKKYREVYNNFLLQIKQIIDQIFNDYNQQIEDLINFFQPINKIPDSSIEKDNEINRNTENKFYNDNNIKSLINEILSLERGKLKNFCHDAEKFLKSPIKLVPSIYLYHMKETFLSIQDINQNTYQKFIEKDYRIVGDYTLTYTFEPKKMKCYCRLMFTSKDDTQKMCFLISQILLVNNKVSEFPMKFLRKDNKTYSYECRLSFDEMKNCDKIQLNTDIVVFSI